MKIHLPCIVWIVVLLFQRVRGQDYYYNNKYYDQNVLIEAGIGLGAVNCLTDLGGKSGTGKSFIGDLNLQNTRPFFGMQLGLKYRYAIDISLAYSAGKITAFDSILARSASSSGPRLERNLSFASRLAEWSVVAGFYPATLFSNGKQSKRGRLAPFFVAGIGVFHFNPRANLDGQWYDLQPLHTEGEGFTEYADRRPYALTQMNWQLGLGISVELSALLELQVEICDRLLHTDYLDDVSTTYIDPNLFQKYLSPEMAGIAARVADRRSELDPLHKTIPGEIRGGSQKNDNYFTFSIKLEYVLNRVRR